MPYFGGSTVHGGKVRRLQCTNFKELVDNYIRVPVSFRLTRKEFNALPEDQRNAEKDGPYICAASWDFEEGHREDHTATAVNLVVVDLDEGDFVHDFFQSPSEIGEHLYPYNFAVWTTAKHTAAKPRLKIVVDVEPCHPSNHRRLANFVISRLGLPDTFKGARETRTLSLPQYRPLKFKDEVFQAVLQARVSGMPLRVSDLPEESSDNPERLFACDRDGDGIDLGLAYLPVMGLSVEDVREPLFSIDADTDYKKWCECATALRHQFTNEDEAREAYSLFDEWSATGNKYKGENETYGKWKSFRPYAKGRAPVTIRTLFHHAQESGWSNSKVAGKLQQTVLEWLREVDDADEAMNEGARRIAAMPFRNDVVEESLILAWRKRLKELSGNLLDKSALKREVNKERKREQAEKQAGREEENRPGWLQPVVYVATMNVFHDHSSGVQLNPESFNRKYAVELMPADEGDVPANGRPIIQPSDYALNLMKIARVDEAIYWPMKNGEDRVVPFNGKKYLNLYNPDTVPCPNPDYAEKAGKLWNQLIGALIKEPELRTLFTDYHAFIVQNPGEKILWSFLIQSGEGAGKGTLARVMRGVLGAPNVATISSEVLKSQWNDWMVGAQYYVSEEVHIPGEMREKVMNGLKTFITDPVITVNKRNVSASCNVPNFANLIAFTNYHDALHLKESNRRWAPIMSPLQSKAAIERLQKSGHFEELQWLTTENGAAGLRYFLQTWKVSDSFPVHGPAPWTPYVDIVIDESKNKIQKGVEDLLMAKTDILIDEETIFMPRLESRLYGVIRDNGRLAHNLRVMGYDRLTGIHRVGSEQGEVWFHTENIGDRDPVKLLNDKAEIGEFEI